MRLLLDTSVLIWAAGEPQRLSQAARAALADHDNALLISVASVWEIGIKFRKGGFPGAEMLARDFEGAMRNWRFTSVPIDVRHAQLAPALPSAHKDPFDRMLAAQAILEDAILVSNDSALDLFGARRLW